LSGLKINSNLRIAIFGALILVIYRVASVFIAPLPLHVDEAQYLGWSYQLDAGYYSKPPFIAWILGLNRFGCQLLGVESLEGCSRASQSVALALASTFSGLSSWALFRDRRVAVLTAVLLISSPLFGFYSLFATTDAWLLMWWSIALWLFILAAHPNQLGIRLWVLCGIVVGFGLLTKYSMGIFVLSAFIWVVISRGLIRLGPWIALCSAILVFLPNIVWNYQNDFPTITHHIHISQVQSLSAEAWNFSRNIKSFSEFFSYQFLLLGPVAMLGFLRFVIKRNTQSAQLGREWQLLLVFALPMLIIISIQAFLSRAHVNWAAPAYIAVAVLIVNVWLGVPKNGESRTGKSLYLTTITVGVVCSLFFVHGLKLIYWNPDSLQLRALESLRGWKEASLSLLSLAEEKHMAIVAEDRRLLAALHAYRGGRAILVLAYDSAGRKDNHYTWFSNIDSKRQESGQEFIWAMVGPEMSSKMLESRDQPLLNQEFTSAPGFFAVVGRGEKIFVRTGNFNRIR
jgi:4-amino-4-deoxy-L-arabinose transferase-like glycosyltransferase